MKRTHTARQEPVWGMTIALQVILLLFCAAAVGATGIEEDVDELEGTVTGPLSRSQFDQRIKENAWLTTLHEYDVAASNGDIIGTVEDSVIDISTGHLVYLGVRITENDHVEAGYYPLPPFVFERDSRRQVFSLVTGDLDFISNAPTFEDLERYTATPTEEGGWEGRISGYWNTAAMPPVVRRARTARRDFGYQYRYAGGSVTFPGTLIRFSTITAQTVNRSSGAPLGAVDDLAVNFQSGNVFFVDLALNRPTGGYPNYVIPLNALVLNRVDFEVSYPATEYGFPAAYGYSDTRPPIDSPDWFADARRFWNRLALGLGYPGGMKVVPRMVTPASFIVGYSVISADTVGLGDIVDALVTTDGDVPYAVVEFDSVLGVSQAQSLIPMNALSVNAVNATATIDIVEGDLEGIPKFEPGELPDTSRPGWDQEFREYWANLHTDLQEIYPEDVATIESIESVEQPEAMPVSAFTSFQVVTENGARVGNVEDVAIDLVRGTAPYLILGVGGFLDIGDTNLAAPFESFAWDPDDARLVTGLSAETLRNAPGFEDDEWPLTGNPELEIEMADYWSKELGG